MARPKVTPRDQERVFRLDELFFSITDRKGVIRSGNEVFVRVSGHKNLDEMIGKPHNIIRHPDMPRAVFKLLWDYLDAGKTFAGYVKNMATDGCYYWVMALVVPINDGYLSVRFKPTTPFLQDVGKLYAEMLAVEQEAGDEPDSWRAGMVSAVECLLAWLKKNGFASYDEFMRAALAEEMSSRRAQLAARPAVGGAKNSADVDLRATLRACEEIDAQLDELFSRAASFLELIQNLSIKSSFLLDLSEEVSLISLNGLIASYRVGHNGGGLSAVTHNLSKLSEENKAVITEMTGELSQSSPLRETAFTNAAAKLQVEMALFFARELIDAEATRTKAEAFCARTRADLSMLVDSFSHSTAQMIETLTRAQASVSLLIQLHQQLYAALRKLSGIRVAGKVQTAYIAEAAYFHNLFDKIHEQSEIAKTELRGFSDAIPFLVEHLPQFENSGRFIQSTLGSLR